MFDITKPSILTANYDDQEYAHALNSRGDHYDDGLLIAMPYKEKENSLMGGGMMTDTVCTDGGEPILDGLDIMAAGTSMKEKQFIVHLKRMLKNNDFKDKLLKETHIEKEYLLNRFKEVKSQLNEMLMRDLENVVCIKCSKILPKEEKFGGHFLLNESK